MLAQPQLHGRFRLRQHRLGQPTTRFDSQADRFDERTGLPDSVAHEIAAALLRITSITGRGLVLEIGPGTGNVGRELMGLGVPYLGVDLSRPMLDVFRRKLTHPQRSVLVVADADGRWPVRDRTIALVFASRAAHLLRPAHVVDEVRRVCRPSGYFIIGRVAREPDSIKSRLRDERLRLSGSRTDSRPRGQGDGRALLELFVGHGAEALARQTVATWTDVTSAQDVIHHWETMDPHGLSYSELRDWARRELGDPRNPSASIESYVLEGVRLGSAAAVDESPSAEPA